MPFRQWKRREFVAALGGAAVGPLAALAQPRALGLTVPPGLLVAADEVIE
jgi:hypothetical protein